MIAITIDGELVAGDRAVISVLDRGLLYGDGVFEILRTWDGVVVDLDAHLDRLYTSAMRASRCTARSMPTAIATSRSR